MVESNPIPEEQIPYIPLLTELADLMQQVLQIARPAGAEENFGWPRYQQHAPLGRKRISDGHATNSTPRWGGREFRMATLPTARPAGAEGNFGWPRYQQHAPLGRKGISDGHATNSTPRWGGREFRMATLLTARPAGAAEENFRGPHYNHIVPLWLRRIFWDGRATNRTPPLGQKRFIGWPRY